MRCLFRDDISNFACHSKSHTHTHTHTATTHTRSYRFPPELEGTSWKRYICSASNELPNVPVTTSDALWFLGKSIYLFVCQHWRERLGMIDGKVLQLGVGGTISQIGLIRKNWVGWLDDVNDNCFDLFERFLSLENFYWNLGAFVIQRIIKMQT